MLDWLGLDRTKMLREDISAYEAELELERSRAASLREKVERLGLDRQAHPASLEAQELQDQIETTDKLIVKMEQVLAGFRGELMGLEEGVTPPKDRPG